MTIFGQYADRPIPVEVLTPEAVKALFIPCDSYFRPTKAKAPYCYKLEIEASYHDFTFDVLIHSSFSKTTGEYYDEVLDDFVEVKDSDWKQDIRITWSADGIRGSLDDIPDFTYQASDRRKATVDAMQTALGVYVCDTLNAVCNLDKLTLIAQEKRSAIETQKAQRQRYDDELKAEEAKFAAYLKELVNSGHAVAGNNVGQSLDLVLTELMLLARLRMRNRRYNIRFDYDGVYLEFMKGPKNWADTQATPDTIQVQIKLRDFDEQIYATQEGVRIIGRPVLTWRGGHRSGYTFVISAERIEQIASALVEINRHDRLVDILTNGKKKDACICCEKTLTDPVSKARWVGPECTKHFQGIFQFQDDGTLTRLLH